MLLKFIKGILRDRKNDSKVLNKFALEFGKCLEGIIECMRKRQKCARCYYFDTKKTIVCTGVRILDGRKERKPFVKNSNKWLFLLVF